MGLRAGGWSCWHCRRNDLVHRADAGAWTYLWSIRVRNRNPELMGSGLVYVWGRLLS